MKLSGFKRLSFALGSVVFGGLLWGSCNQDPIFYGISLEVEPVDPRIVGMPTHIVAIGNTFYTASKFSKDIQAYKKDGGWHTLSPGPGGPIIDLAATESHLYALTGEPGATALYKWDPVTDAGEAVGNAGRIQSIYGANKKLFACAGTDPFTLLHDNGGTLEELSGGNGFLQGAVYKGTDYYLAGTGIFRLAGTNLTVVTGTEGSVFSGLIVLEDQVVGVSGQTLFVLSPEGALQEKKDMGATFTGAMALWGKKVEPAQEAPEPKTLLLLGIQGSSTSTTHGYREILLSNGTLNPGDMDLRTPGRDPSNSSVSDYDKYNSSLGKHPVLTLFQAADGILFAGTTKNGLWSYRNDQWNAEP